MSFLDELQPQDRALVISLPYRVGIWISHADDTGGEEASLEEKAALANIIDGFTREVFGSEAVQHIMMETLQAKNEWEGWAHNYKTILEDAQKAVDILNEVIDPKEVSAYRQRLFEIAEAVALAFREYDALNLQEKLRIYMTYHVKKITASKKKAQTLRPINEYLNVSVKERMHLRKLADVLTLDYH
ncbi:MAG: hypothetical protein ACK4VI_06335 [Alphaproteobacteria bacterium]